MTSTVLCGRGGSGRSMFTAGNGAELVSCASHWGRWSFLEHGRLNYIVSKLNECHSIVKKALGDQFRLL